MNQARSSLVYLNGTFVPGHRAKISLFDRGLLYGEGLFETMRSYSGQVFRLDEHLRRLRGSCKLLNIKLSLNDSALKKAVYKTLKKNNLADAYIRITVTKGEAEPGFSQAVYGEPNLFIIAHLFKPYPPRLYETGLKAIISKIKQNEGSPLVNIKSLNFLNNILAKNEAYEKGAGEAILTNTKGYITEAATSNIFLVLGHSLITPSIDSGILPGITRQAVLEIASKLKLKTKTKKILPAELFKADEIFLTNSLAEIVPVVKINKKIIGNGRAGQITQLIHKQYRQLVRKNLG
ncbi:MAG: aminotransferase class IV [bacterium]